MDRAQAVAAMTVLVCEQGFTEPVAREILAADLEYSLPESTPDDSLIASVEPGSKAGPA